MTKDPVPWWAQLLIDLLQPKPLDLTGLAGAVERVERIVQVARPAEPTKENTMSQQDDVNAFVARLSTATDAIRAEIAALQSANPALDLTGLEAAVGGVEGLEPPVVAPPVDVPPAS